VSKPSKQTSSGSALSRRGNQKSPAWNASSMRCVLSWLTWPLFLVYDRLLRLVSRAALALATVALRRLNKLRADRCGAL
jgi:hypothetical protein